MNIQIHRANSSDHFALTQVAMESKGYWGYPEAWLSAWTEKLRITPQTIEKHQVYKAQGQGEIAAFYVLIIEEGKALLDHLWVKPAFIGQGIGRMLFEHALNQAAEYGANQVEIESDPNALGFYLKMGAHQVGTRPASFNRELPLLVIEVERAYF